MHVPVMPSIALNIALVENVDPSLGTLPLASCGLGTEELVLTVPNILVVLTAAVEHLGIASEV